MRNVSIGLIAVMLAVATLAAQNPNPRPSCNMCPASYIPNDEIQAYVKRAIANGIVDQQVRAVDIGKSNVDVGIVYRGKLDKPGNASVAEHDLVSEVYHIIDGAATLVTGPDILEMQR